MLLLILPYIFITQYRDRFNTDAGGVPCGKGWISRRKKCSKEKSLRSGSSHPDRLKRLAKTRREAKTRHSLLGDIKQARSRGQTKAQKLQGLGAKNAFTQYWASSWAKTTPKLLQQAIAKVPAPTERHHKVSNISAYADVTKGKIMIGTHQLKGDSDPHDRSGAVYRHEFGHHLDYQMGKIVSMTPERAADERELSRLETKMKGLEAANNASLKQIDAQKALVAGLIDKAGLTQESERLSNEMLDLSKRYGVSMYGEGGKGYAQHQKYLADVATHREKLRLVPGLDQAQAKLKATYTKTDPDRAAYNQARMAFVDQQFKLDDYKKSTFYSFGERFKTAVIDDKNHLASEVKRAKSKQTRLINKTIKSIMAKPGNPEVNLVVAGFNTITARMLADNTDPKWLTKRLDSSQKRRVVASSLLAKHGVDPNHRPDGDNIKNWLKPLDKKHKEIADLVDFQAMDVFERTKVISAILSHQATGNPEDIIGFSHHIKDTNTGGTINGMVPDLAGAITLNKIGYGHSDEYYERHATARFTEAFANITAIYDGRQGTEEILNAIAPNALRDYKQALKELNRGTL